MKRITWLLLAIMAVGFFPHSAGAELYNEDTRRRMCGTIMKVIRGGQWVDRSTEFQSITTREDRILVKYRLGKERPRSEWTNVTVYWSETPPHAGNQVCFLMDVYDRRISRVLDWKPVKHHRVRK